MIICDIQELFTRSLKDAIVCGVIISISILAFSIAVKFRYVIWIFFS